jgi:hypothetical protein
LRVEPDIPVRARQAKASSLRRHEHRNLEYRQWSEAGR